MVRVLDDGGLQHGDPQHWAASCRFIDRETVEILGVDKALSPGDWKAVLKCMAEQGAGTVMYTRHKDGTTRTRTRKVDE